MQNKRLSPLLPTLPSLQYRLPALVLILLLGTLLRTWQLGQIPPGLNFDEAKYGTDALSIINGQGFPGFPANFGREPLFSFAAAGAFQLFGISAWALRFVSASAGILTIAAIYILCHRIFRDESAIRREVLSLAAALLLAVLPWHYSLSRMTFRAILVPLFSILAFYCLWRGLRIQKQSWIVAAGAFTGAGLHTYQAARLIPVLIVIALGLFAISQKHRFKWLVKQTLLVGIVATLIFAPLGYYFLTHPGAFLERATQANVARDAAGLAGKITVIAQNSLSVLGMFTFSGDQDPRFNIPGRPLFDPFLALLFLVGLIVNLRRIRKPEYALNLIWLGTMLIPSMLADFAPSYKRTVGAIPPAVIVIALGIGGCWQLITWLAHRLKPSAQSLGWRIAALALMTGLIASTVTNTYAYFATWGQAGYLYTAFDTGLMTTGNYVSTLPNDERIYLSPVAADYPTFVVASLNRQAVHSFDGRRCTVLPDRPATPATYVLLTAEPARRDRRSEGILSATYPTLKLVAQDSDRDSPYFKAFGLPAGSAPVLKSMQPVSATFGDQIDLLGYDLGAPSWTTGQTAQLVIYWRARRAIGTNYTLFVHVTPDDETEQAARPLIQDDRQPCDGSYPTTVWPTDEVVVEFRKMDLPADLPPGKYTVSVGWYLLSDLSHLPVTSGPNSVGEDQFTLAQVQIGRP